jgi:hypothetical protein
MKKIVINIFILYRKNSLRGAPLFKYLIPIISKTKKDILIRQNYFNSSLYRDLLLKITCNISKVPC